MLPTSLQERLALAKRLRDDLISAKTTLKKARTESIQSSRPDFVAPAALPPPPPKPPKAHQKAKKPKPLPEDQPCIQDCFQQRASKARQSLSELTHKPKPEAKSKQCDENIDAFSLQFVYRKIHESDEKETFLACTPTSISPLIKPFDFDKWCKDTNTPAFPPKFQTLVQRAIQHELCPPPVPSYTLTHFSATLTSKQVLALEFTLSHPYCLLNLPTGLGKTAIGFAAIATQWQEMEDEHSLALVVCPASLRTDVWLDEAKQKFLKDHIDQLLIIDEIKTAELSLQQHPDARVVVVSYTMLENIKQSLFKRKWHMIVADEAHALQSASSQCSKVIAALRTKVNRVILMSATSADNSVVYYNLLKTVEPDLFKDFFHYKPPHIKWNRSTETFYYAEWYVAPDKVYTASGGLKWQFKRPARLNELHALCRQFAFEQDKQACLPEVLPLIYESIEIGSATGTQQAQFQKAMQRVIEVERRQGSTSAQALFMEQVRLTAVNKLPLVLAYIQHLLDVMPPDFKFIVWGYHKDVLESIDASLTQLGIGHILIYGKTSRKQRDKLKHKLQHDPKCRVGVLSLACCGTGMTFTYLQVTVYAELIFSFKLMCQSEGRTYRKTQLGQTVAKYLMLKNSTDDVVWKALQRKRDNESVILRNKHAKITLTNILATLTPLLVTRYDSENYVGCDDDHQGANEPEDELVEWLADAPTDDTANE